MRPRRANANATPAGPGNRNSSKMPTLAASVMPTPCGITPPTNPAAATAAPVKITVHGVTVTPSSANNSAISTRPNVRATSVHANARASVAAGSRVWTSEPAPSHRAMAAADTAADVEDHDGHRDADRAGTRAVQQHRDIGSAGPSSSTSAPAATNAAENSSATVFSISRSLISATTARSTGT